ncbi:MAG: SoxR reducing system RseC family protein [candidate division WOR-3 bacterium]
MQFAFHLTIRSKDSIIIITKLMEENGRIVEITAEGAKVEVVPTSICGSCVSASICAALGSKTKIVLASNPINAQVGDLVKIEIKEKSRTTSFLLVFGLPILGLLIGIILGEIIDGDRLAVILGGSGLLLALVFLKIIDTRLSKKENFLPTVVEKISENNAGVSSQIN